MAYVSDVDIIQMLQKRVDKEDRGAKAKQKLDSKKRHPATAGDKGVDAGGPSKPRKTKSAALEMRDAIKNMKNTEYTSLLENMKSIKLARRYLSERKLQTEAIERTSGKKSSRIPYHPHELTDQQIMHNITQYEEDISHSIDQFAYEEAKLAAAHGSKHVAPDVNAQRDDTKNRLSSNCLKVALEIGMNDDIAKHINCAREIHKLEVRRADINQKYEHSTVILAEIRQDITKNKVISKELQTDLDNIKEYREALQKCQKTDDALMALLVAMK